MNKFIAYLDQKILFLLGLIGAAISGFIGNNILSSISHASFLKYDPYQEIGYYAAHPSPYVFQALTIALLLAFLVFLCLTIYSLIKRKGFFSLLFIIVCISNFLGTIMQLQSYTANTYAIATSANIQIVSPYVSNQQYKQMKSDFLQINSKERFDKLDSQLRQVAKEHHANLQ